MSLRLIIAGYTLCILAAIAGCSAIIRSGHATHRLQSLIAGLCCVLLGILLFASQPYLPAFLTIVLANEAFLVAFIFFHQAIAAILESSRRYLGLSMFLVGFQFTAFLYFTYTLPDLRARILVRTVAISIQCAVSVVVLFRHRSQALRYARRIAGGVFSVFLLFQISRLIATLIWNPSFNRLQLDSIQAFYATFGFILGLGAVVAITWLGMSAQRENLQLMATTDGLSGLMNRRTFDQVLQRELQYAERRGEPIALLMIDIDHFKEINDKFGHQMGDEVIRRLSRLLCINTRAMDAVARYGGEEFAMVLRGMHLYQAQSIAERLRTQIEAMAGLPEPLRVTASIGIAIAGNGDTVSSLLRRSDSALYLSKRNGRNQVCTQFAYSEF